MRPERVMGAEPALAMEVARQLSARDALGAHAREELGITETLRARPLQAAVSSAASFIVGAALPMVTAILAPAQDASVAISVATVIGLLLSGGIAAWLGGAPVVRGALRVGFWGALAMVAAGVVGRLFDAAV
jgi:VIT1/CCC1 family predicted Fe2+/Mn2+ transporter